MESIKMANPAPLGLIGFGSTTILLNLHNAQIIELSVVIAAMGFAVGGIAQVIAGIYDLKCGSTFGGTAFVGYGCFWLSLVFIWLNPTGMMLEADEMSMGFYLAIWGIISLFMFIGTLRHNRATQVVFLSLTVLFFGLAANDFLGTYLGTDLIGIIAGYVGIFCGGAALYSAMGQVLKGEYGREILPLGELKKKEAETAEKIASPFN